jgi:hypothetical protein
LYIVFLAGLRQKNQNKDIPECLMRKTPPLNPTSLLTVLCC